MTLWEKYAINDNEISVYRDDLNTLFPDANNSKSCGIRETIQNLQNKYTCFVSHDTSISRVGWATAKICYDLGINHFSVVSQRNNLTFYQKMTKYWGSNLLKVRGSFSSAMRAQAEKKLSDYGIKDYYFLPNGCSTTESVFAHALEVKKANIPSNSEIFISTSSGTVVAGIMYGLMITHNASCTVNAILCSSFKNREKKIYNLIRSVTSSYDKDLFGEYLPKLNIIDEHFKYKQKITHAPPFPCDMYLDRKAWITMEELIVKDQLYNESKVYKDKNIVFWNIGGEWNPEKGLTKGLRGDGVVTHKQIYDCLKQVI